MRCTSRILQSAEPKGLADPPRFLLLSVVALALMGVAIKYRRGGGWLFTRDVSDGFLRPSAAVPQLLFALYGVCRLLAIACYRLSYY